MSTSPALRAAARVVSSGMLRNTSRLTAGGLRQKPDRKSTRLNSSHSQISYAVFLFKKNTRLNSSHSQISYAVFCLKKKQPPDIGFGGPPPAGLHLAHARLTPGCHRDIQP